MSFQFFLNTLFFINNSCLFYGIFLAMQNTLTLFLEGNIHKFIIHLKPILKLTIFCCIAFSAKLMSYFYHPVFWQKLKIIAWCFSWVGKKGETPQLPYARTQ